jgi:catechol 2,3-dioxygenase-like lactoylglutathione lyase family enzyme
MILGLHHAQVTIPVGAEDAARRFFCGELGLREIPKPAVLAVRGGFWLELGNAQLHVGVENGVDRRHTKAHVALEVDDAAALRTRLEGLGLEILDGERIPGLARFEFRDPFGNRMEVVQRVEDRA